MLLLRRCCCCCRFAVNVVAIVVGHERRRSGKKNGVQEGRTEFDGDDGRHERQHRDLPQPREQRRLRRRRKIPPRCRRHRHNGGTADAFVVVHRRRHYFRPNFSPARRRRRRRSGGLFDASPKPTLSTSLSAGCPFMDTDRRFFTTVRQFDTDGDSESSPNSPADLLSHHRGRRSLARSSRSRCRPLRVLPFFVVVVVGPSVRPSFFFRRGVAEI